MQEKWAPVKGFEGIYEVSSLGNVRSCDRYTYNSLGIKMFHSGIPKRTHLNNYGYETVILSRNGKGKTFSVHRLVADAFIGIPDGMVVNHIDGDTTNNSLENLEVITQKENIDHAIRTGLWQQKNKPVIDSLGNVYKSIKQASLETGIGRRSIGDAVNKHRRTEDGRYWKFVNESDYNDKHSTPKPVKRDDGRIFMSINAAAKYCGVSPCALSTALKKGSKCCDHKWFYF